MLFDVKIIDRVSVVILMINRINVVSIFVWVLCRVKRVCAVRVCVVRNRY